MELAYDLVLPLVVARVCAISPVTLEVEPGSWCVWVALDIGGEGIASQVVVVEVVVGGRIPENTVIRVVGEKVEGDGVVVYPRSCIIRVGSDC